MHFNIISHTHWDREWHKTFEEYRVRLVAFFDNLIDLLEHDPEYRSFLMDGQTIVLEDYLAIKPYKKQQLQQLIKEKRIIVGPWYIQPDEFIPGGEFQIRNLLIGQQVAEEFGETMQVGYLPDSFGQAAQIPQLLQGFGIEYAVFWRGLTEEECPDLDFIWQSNDGSTVKTTVLAEGYGNARMLNASLDNNVGVIQENIEKLYAKSGKHNLLLMCGFDQRNANPQLPDIIKALNEQMPAHQFTLSTLEEYLAAAFRTGVKKTVTGEFRKGKYMRVHVSIGMTRMDIKQENYHTQTLMQRIAEPLMSCASLQGLDYSRELARQAYKYILQNHAHDSICCVCTDSTHEQMMQRYHSARQIAKVLADDAFTFISHNIAWQQAGVPVVLFNLSGTARRGLEKITLVTGLEHFRMVDGEQRPVKMDIISKAVFNQNDVQIEIGSKNEDVLLYQYELLVDVDFTGFGYQTLYMQQHNAIANSANQPLFDRQTATFTTDYFRLHIQPNGALTYTDRATGECFTDLNYLIENGSAGDEYDYSPPLQDIRCHPHHVMPEIQIVHNSTLAAQVKLTFNFSVPKETFADRRSDETLNQTIVCLVSVKKDCRRVDFRTTIDNQANNHRICVTFRDNQQGDRHFAEQQYGMLYRANTLADPQAWTREGWEERYYPIYPQQRYMGFDHASGRAIIFNKGLVNYEITVNDSLPIVSIPLLCTMDYMGKQDLVDRPGRRSGLHLPVPDSLLHGSHTFEYAFMFTDALSGDLAAQADYYQLPLTVKTPINAGGNMADKMMLFSVGTPNISVMAFKRCEVGSGYILRLVNQSAEKIKNIHITINKAWFTRARKANLKEQELYTDNNFTLADGILAIETMKGNEIITFILDRF
ncbi:alpha-mannosidase [Superficieibacter electus]|uniref:Alpha-mannosidase n=1 Tax=Superficieibacter electus TaxID=2022662 RepID=A0A2P5GL79_9ENTR|nr:glycoside hydrolase family 38 C-terminal domain-containing protein [Superficieibacter electus]POP42672.1 alpha-mannosidase [Superficieibacter electus]POP45748.1 alpha-mannosidase [Superficieibacter electus]